MIGDLTLKGSRVNMVECTAKARSVPPCVNNTGITKPDGVGVGVGVAVGFGVGVGVAVGFGVGVGVGVGVGAGDVALDTTSKSVTTRL